MKEEVLEDIEMAANDHGESHWMVDRRLNAAKSITSLPAGFEIDKLNFKRSNKDLAKITDEPGIKVVQLGQKIIKNELPDELDDKGVVLTDIFTALREHPRLIQRYFMDKVINYDESNLTRYHLAMINSGIFLYIPKGIKIDQPIVAQIIQDSTVKNPMVSHILIVAEEDSQVTFKQTSITVGDESNIVQPFVEILTRAKSIVHYQSKDKYAKNSQVFFDNQGFLNRESQIDWDISIQNEDKTVGKIVNNLFGSNSTANVNLDSKNKNNEIDLSVKKHGKDVNYSETII
ncbi:SufD family Fe-S cluster assembly protein [Companilactobacillus baiquanensis]|uniref:Fe-S cluster assembly protein SufD n=1 Tax=Companilactobacillus baiquanensis TaxID=2486005 RepID=A0ABW1UUC9_9LACO|nr:hypothetical protein [Companilactobacillus baiquanensis]